MGIVLTALINIVPVAAYAQGAMAQETIVVRRSRNEAAAWMIANRDLIPSDVFTRINEGRVRIMLSSTRHPVRYGLVARADAPKLVTILDILCANRGSRAIHLTCRTDGPGERWRVRLTDRLCAHSREPLTKQLPRTCTRPYLTSIRGKTIIVPHPVYDEVAPTIAPSAPDPGPETLQTVSPSANTPPAPGSSQAIGTGPANPVDVRTSLVDRLAATEQDSHEQPQESPLLQENRRLREVLYATLTLFSAIPVLILLSLSVEWWRKKRDTATSEERHPPPQTREVAPVGQTQDPTPNSSALSVVVSLEQPTDETGPDYVSSEEHEAALNEIAELDKLNEVLEGERARLIEHNVFLGESIAALEANQAILFRQVSDLCAANTVLEGANQALQDRIEAQNSEARLAGAPARPSIIGAFTTEADPPPSQDFEASSARLHEMHPRLEIGEAEPPAQGSPSNGGERVTQGFTQSYVRGGAQQPAPSSGTWGSDGSNALQGAAEDMDDLRDTLKRESTSPGLGPKSNSPRPMRSHEPDANVASTPADESTR